MGHVGEHSPPYGATYSKCARTTVSEMANYVGYCMRDRDLLCYTYSCLEANYQTREVQR